jgi:hypothetical protein
MNTIDKVTFRPFRDPTDYAAMVPVHEARKVWDQIDSRCTRERLMRFTDAQENAAWTGDPGKNMLFVEAGQRVIGYGQICNWQEESVAVLLYLWYLVPEWRGRGVK